MGKRQYDFRTVWELGAPIGIVWDSIICSEKWPLWWPCLEGVEDGGEGDADGIGSIRRFSWRASIFYRISIEVLVTRKEPPFILEGMTSGDLEGSGRWTLSGVGAGLTRVEYDLNVRTTKLWMNMVAPLAHGLFSLCHDRVMRAGGAGLERYLKENHAVDP